ncbi:MAG TPA: DUF2062 domain-containing protein [Hyphomicrobiales bacterium]|nr:DUF2062 domain-containing protein [Hyphomicrobiales bacterium]
MLFRRRTPLTQSERLRAMVWPRTGFRRAILYRAKRLARVAASPHAVAAGAAAGAFAAFSPFFGFHYIIAATLAFVSRGSIIASAILTTAANPLTLPLFWTLSFWVGHLLLGGSEKFDAAKLLSEHSTKALMAVFKPLVFGSVIVGAVVAIVVYFLVRRGVVAYRTRRRHRLAKRRMALMQGVTP